MEKFTFHVDPGHGWLEVDWTQLKRLELNPSDFSRYSYRNGNTFFLEEDCDASIFVNAYNAKHGDDAFTYESKHVNNSHPIRNYPQI